MSAVTPNRGVSPVISVVLMVAVTVMLAGTMSTFALGFTQNLNGPAPNVAQTSGEFVPGASAQRVRITHEGGDSVAVEEIEIIVRASGPSLDAEARLVDLPADDTTIDAKNIEGTVGLIDKGTAVQIIQEDDSNVWSAGDTIQFEINVGDADFREPPTGSNPDADELQVIIVHTSSNQIIFDETFRP